MAIISQQSIDLKEEKLRSQYVWEESNNIMKVVLAV